MTPQEKQMIDDLFGRLARVDGAPRDPAAERAIADGLQRAPNAVYALVQTVLVQDEALKQAEARINQLSGHEDPQQQPEPGFLDSVREAFGGARRGSVPSVRAAAPESKWNTGNTGYQQQGYPQQQAYVPQQGYQQPMQAGGGSSFLGTAAATAAGVIGGSMLMNSLGSMFGNRHSGSAFGDTQQASSPWDSGGNSSGGSLAQEAGLNDVAGGRFGNNYSNNVEDRRSGLFGGNDDAGGDVDDGSYDAGDIGGDSSDS